MSKKDRVSAFLHDTDKGTLVEFDDVPDARIYSTSVKDAKEALRIAGKDASASEWRIARLIVTTVDAESGEPYFDEAHFDSLCEARGDALKRLEALMDAAEGGGQGNDSTPALDD